MDAGNPDEATPLLSNSTHTTNTPKGPTPLPKSQIAIVLLLQICEPITSLSIYPYINQLISSLDITGGDEKKVGYYAGLIQSLFFATEALTVLQWGRMSDYTGRKPVILIGLFGTMISMLSFGLSRTFWALVLSRCLIGLLNGNIGVMKSVLGELTDPSNRADAFALLPIPWGIGATIGPMLGGILSRPQQRFPGTFGGKFWKEYPYFLPCLVAASFVLFAFIIALLFFKETVKRQKNSREDSNLKDNEQPVPLRKLFTYPVVLSISNYVVLSFLNIAICALMPLFFAMPLEIGGLGFDPPKIGYIIGFTGVVTAPFQAMCFSRLVRYFGTRKVFIMCLSTLIPIFLSFPLMNMAAVTFGVQSPLVLALILFLIVCLAFAGMAFGTIFMYVTASAPNKRTLGATNGLAQTTVSIARAIGPAFSTSLFSFCVEHNILGGYGVYAILLLLNVGALFLAALLPSEPWDENDEA